MGSKLNALRWDGRPGHYEVYYLTLTDRASGCGIWIRYTMVAPTDGGQATASLWLIAMEPEGNGPPLGRKATWPADALRATADPFELRIDDAVLSEAGASGAFEDSVFVPRLGRELGPTTPVVGRIGGREFRSTKPLRVSGNPSTFAMTSWDFEARDVARKLAVDVDAPRETLVGVTYTDPDGEPAYCYNSEVASLRCRAYQRDKAEPSGWRLVETLVARRRAHFEYAQRQPVPGVELQVT
jgi:hypothetical protein